MFELDLKQDDIDIDKNGHPHWWKYFLCGIKGVVQEISGFKWRTGIQGEYLLLKNVILSFVFVC